MADLVNQRLADDGAHLVIIDAILFNRFLEQRHPVGQGVAEAPPSFGSGVPW